MNSKQISNGKFSDLHNFVHKYYHLKLILAQKFEWIYEYCCFISSYKLIVSRKIAFVTSLPIKFFFRGNLFPGRCLKRFFREINFNDFFLVTRKARKYLPAKISSIKVGLLYNTCPSHNFPIFLPLLMIYILGKQT